jgi:hypothetical protein
MPDASSGSWGPGSPASGGRWATTQTPGTAWTCPTSSPFGKSTSLDACSALGLKGVNAEVKLAEWFMQVNHMSFMLHVELREA